MAATYEPLATTTLSTTQNQIDFNSISGSYTDLIVIVNGGVTSSQDIWLRFNSDTGTNYSRQRLYGDGGAGACVASRSSTLDAIFINAGSVGAYTAFTINIMNYSNTTTYKTTLSRFGSSTYAVLSSGMWRSTSAITSLTLKAGGSDTFTSGSTFTLYGIKAA